ncbi:MAG TPA: transcriptional repressor [Spirochaetia bacterium]|nr:transcriptional repressor [Spirochaetales bacterium]HRY80431.1 transcriptional repressor [Spirochaetia bacterium]HRZ88044.1 transcriptional repressor [Spirochaetia bacterium]
MEGIERSRKRSRQREEILAVLRSTKEHPTAAMLHTAARRRIPRLSLGTVYRNLDVLEEMGLVLHIRNGNAQDRFDGDVSPHYHFVCDACGAVLDMPLPYRPELDEAAAREGFRVRGHRLDFHGTCPACSKP